jgi:hypothetical protein
MAGEHSDEIGTRRGPSKMRGMYCETGGLCCQRIKTKMRNGGRNSCRSALLEEFWSRDYFSLVGGPLSICWIAAGKGSSDSIEYFELKQ